MSVVSSVLSTRSSGWKLNPRISSLMDSIFAIAFGLGLRFVVDTVSHHDFKLTGTLVGLWEGIILLHFLKKMPKSTDPYLAYAVRLFIDFLFTDSVARLVLVLVWTALGMVLADVTPAVWDDVGLNRIWRRFRRDIYTMTQMIPTVAFFPPARTVRFSPSRQPSVIMEEPSVLDSPSVITTELTPTTPTIIPVTITSTTSGALKRRVPGHFSAGFSDTDTDLGSIRAGRTAGRTSRRLSVYPEQQDYDDSATDLSSNNDADLTNRSSGASSASTERGESSAIIDIAAIPDMEEALVVDTAVGAVKEEGDQTPRAIPMYLPPTPSDSAVRWRHNNLDPDEPLPIRPFSVVRPLSESLAQIPDFLDEPVTEDWEKIQPQDYADKPPTPPAKDDLPARFVLPPVPTIPPPQPNRSVEPVPELTAEDEWEKLKSNFVVPEDRTAKSVAGKEPPTYKESSEFDDIYGDDEHAPEPRLDDPVPNDIYDNNMDSGAPPPPTNFMDDTEVPPLAAPFTFNFNRGASNNPWGPTNDSLDDFARQQKEDEERYMKEVAAEEAKQQAAAEAQLQLEREEEERLQKEIEAEEERMRLEAEEADKERMRLEAEEVEKERQRWEAEEAEKERQRQAEKAKKEAEKAERKKKEEEDELARKKKREEDAAEAKRLEDERKAEEKKKKKEEKAKKKEEDARKKEEEAKKVAEAEAARVAEEEAKKAAQRRKDAEEAAARRQAAADEAEKQEREAAEAQAANEERERQLELEKEAETARLAEEAVAAALAAEASAPEAQSAEHMFGDSDMSKPLPPVAADEEPLATNDLLLTPVGHSALLDADQMQNVDELATPLIPINTLDAALDQLDGNNEAAPDAQGDMDGLADAQGEPDPAPGSPAVAESVITEASEMPKKAGDRLDRLLLAKAQMIETRDIIERLKLKLAEPDQDMASLTADIQRTEKILRKMERKESRRYTEGIAEHAYLKDNELETDTLSFGNSTPQATAVKTEEKLEAMMGPGVKSLELNLVMGTGKKNSNGPKQKTKLSQLLQEYGLFDYTTEGAGRTFHVKVSEEDFPKWLIAYRTGVTAAADEDDGWNR